MGCVTCWVDLGMVLMVFLGIISKRKKVDNQDLMEDKARNVRSWWFKHVLPVLSPGLVW